MILLLPVKSPALSAPRQGSAAGDRTEGQREHPHGTDNAACRSL